MAKMTDKWSNMFTSVCTESAAATLTFTEVNMGLNIFDKVGVIINRVEYHVPASTMQNLAAANDVVECALTTSNQMSDLSADEEALLDKIYLAVVPNAAGEWPVKMPVIHEFQTLPGGGIITAPRPLYGAIKCAGMAAAQTITIRFAFQLVQLAQGDYLELLETRRFLG